LTVRHTKAIGKTIKCMEKVYSGGLTGAYTKAITLTIRKKGWEKLLGPMEESTRACG
jgi:hypothetical protein